MALTFVALESSSNIETLNVLTETPFTSTFVAFPYLFNKVKSSIWVGILQDCSSVDLYLSGPSGRSCYFL